MTLPVRRVVIRPSFASIADTLREEFANKGLRLYKNIYIDRALGETLKRECHLKVVSYRMKGSFASEFLKHSKFNSRLIMYPYTHTHYRMYTGKKPTKLPTFGFR